MDHEEKQMLLTCLIFIWALFRVLRHQLTAGPVVEEHDERFVVFFPPATLGDMFWQKVSDIIQLIAV